MEILFTFLARYDPGRLEVGREVNVRSSAAHEPLTLDRAEEAHDRAVIPPRGGRRGPASTFGTDFTGCPVAALRDARGRQAAVVVLDVAKGHARVTGGLWAHAGAKLLMIWRQFDDLIVAR